MQISTLKRIKFLYRESLRCVFIQNARELFIIPQLAFGKLWMMYFEKPKAENFLQAYETSDIFILITFLFFII